MSRDFLIITLAAPMGSFGQEAGYERRGSRERPGKAALIGLAGAALGIRRDDSQGQRDLRKGYDIAVRVNNPGTPLLDFHTAMYVPTARIKRPQTRAKALAALKPKDNPEITRREYRMDVHYTIAYAPSENARWPLSQLRQAFDQPKFTLYLGRKSCPLSLPLDPQIISADDILQALSIPAATSQSPKQLLTLAAVSPSRTKPYAAINATTPLANTNERPALRQERCNDEPLDRQRWHFTHRREAIYPLAPPSQQGDNT